VADFLRRRDESSFRALYREHNPALYRLARRLLAGPEADAEEAVQEAWIVAVRRLSAFRWESSLRTWLSGIVFNACREIRRAAARAGPEPSPGRSELPGAGQAKEGPLDLETAVAALPEGYREVLLLHDVEGFTHQEIARILGIEEGTSKSQLSRARKTIRDRLTPERTGSPIR
jgi:RNA polymerase sigma-70 factor (ECF subfamily)